MSYGWPYIHFLFRGFPHPTPEPIRFIWEDIRKICSLFSSKTIRAAFGMRLKKSPSVFLWKVAIYALVFRTNLSAPAHCPILFMEIQRKLPNVDGTLKAWRTETLYWKPNMFPTAPCCVINAPALLLCIFKLWFLKMEFYFPEAIQRYTCNLFAGGYDTDLQFKLIYYRRDIPQMFDNYLDSRWKEESIFPSLPHTWQSLGWPNLFSVIHPKISAIFFPLEKGQGMNEAVWKLSLDTPQFERITFSFQIALEKENHAEKLRFVWNIHVSLPRTNLLLSRAQQLHRTPWLCAHNFLSSHYCTSQSWKTTFRLHNLKATIPVL